jgi:hypothetical protein
MGLMGLMGQFVQTTPALLDRAVLFVKGLFADQGRAQRSVVV